MTPRPYRPPISLIDVAECVRLHQPVRTAALARHMGISLRSAHKAVHKARRMGFIRRLPNDVRWWIVRVG